MNPTLFDLIIIGGGPGGYVAAIRAAQLGMTVACVDREAMLGGTCLRVGCIPSKVLLESSAKFWEASHVLSQHGIRTGPVELDLPTLLRRKDTVVQTLSKGIDGLFRKNRIQRFQGHARIVGPGNVEVQTSSGPAPLQARSILIATGSKPAELKGVELDHDRIGTSTEALRYSLVPQHLVVIGAGVIGLELGAVWRRLGAKVTVLEYLPRILPGLDAEMATEAQRVFQRQGFEFRLGCRVTSARAHEGGAVVECEGAEPLPCDRVLLAVGRAPVTEGLGLETVGITLDPRGHIPVTGGFATSAPNIYAVGDVIGGPLLAHKAQEEGAACAELLAGQHGHVDYSLIPGVVYTQPEIAAVGLTEEQLKESSRDYRKGTFPFLASGRARALGQTDGKVKVLADAKTDRILGVHILGPHAGDLLAEAVAAMAFGASSESLARVCHAHPSLSEALKEAALAVAGRALHL